MDRCLVPRPDGSSTVERRGTDAIDCSELIRAMLCRRTSPVTRVVAAQQTLVSLEYTAYFVHSRASRVLLVSCSFLSSCGRSSCGPQPKRTASRHVTPISHFTIECVSRRRGGRRCRSGSSCSQMKGNSCRSHRKTSSSSSSAPRCRSRRAQAGASLVRLRLCHVGSHFCKIKISSSSALTELVVLRSRSNKFKGKGRVYCTTQRIIFVAEKGSMQHGLFFEAFVRRCRLVLVW